MTPTPGSRELSLPPARLLTTTLLLTVCAAAACSVPDAPSAATKAAPSPALTVLATAVAQPFATPIEAVGTAMARESVDITSKISNTVARIAFEEGQRVARGALLVELDSAEVNAELAGAQSALAESRRQFERSRDLAARKLLSAAQLDQIEATLNGAQARSAAARARRANTMIRAPFAGRTGFRHVSVGGLVNPGTVITTLDDTSIIKLEFTVPETQIALLERGLRVEARAAGLPDRSFTGAISLVDARVDPVSRSIRVRAELPNADGLLKPGMFMTVRLEGRSAVAVVVPEAAIVPEQGRSFVYVVGADRRASRRAVQIGRRRVGEVEIAAGLKAGEAVIVEGTQGVRDGGLVRTVAATGQPRADR